MLHHRADKNAPLMKSDNENQYAISLSKGIWTSYAAEKLGKKNKDPFFPLEMHSSGETDGTWIHPATAAM